MHLANKRETTVSRLNGQETARTIGGYHEIGCARFRSGRSRAKLSKRREEENGGDGEDGEERKREEEKRRGEGEEEENAVEAVDRCRRA